MKKFLISSLVFMLSAISGWAGESKIITDDLTQIECSIRPLPKISCRIFPSVPHIRLDDSASLNWSGYAALTSLTKPASGSVTDVSAYWTVPTLTSTSSKAFSAIWCGIDGYASSTVEQIGTEQDWTSKGQRNYAWFEMYPNGLSKSSTFQLTMET